MYHQDNALTAKTSACNQPHGDSEVSIRLLHQEKEGQLYLEENTLLFVCRGHWHIEHGETRIEARPQETVFLRKHILIRYHAASGMSTAGAAMLMMPLHCHVMRDFVKQAHLQSTSPASARRIFLHQPGLRLLSCLQSVETYFRNGAAMTQGLTHIKLQEMLHCLPGSTSDQTLLEQVLDLRESYRTDITSIIEQNLTNTVTLGQLARLSGRSLSSFRRDFLAIYNMPPSKWIRIRRLEKSRELLAGTRMTITDICYTLGFENIAHFSRLFKSRFGMPPSACRTPCPQGLRATVSHAVLA